MSASAGPPAVHDLRRPQGAGIDRVYVVTVILASLLAVADCLKEIEAIGDRTRVGVADVAVALALLPPLVNAGLLLGVRDSAAAMGALLLVLTNVVCLNLAGVVTFRLQRIRPRSWWEEDRARKATRIALWLLSLLLAGLLALMVLVWGG